MMKRLFYLVLGLVVFAGCHKDDSEKEEVLLLDEHRFELPADGGTISVQVTSNVKYTVTIPEDFREWLSEESSKVSKTNIFTVSANGIPEVREGYLVFAGDSLRDTVYVVQAPGIGEDFTEKKVSGVLLDMVYVKAGSFMMGASEDDEEVYGWEMPEHQVTLTNDYYIGKHEVTQGVWKAVMGNNPSYFAKGDDYPVEKVSWDDVQVFIAKLNELTGKKYALPTEAQWEYAARGGEKSKGYKYSGSNDLAEVAWYDFNSDYETHLVGMKAPNELGIYDMTGNVWEWCQDWYDDYSSDAQIDPVGPEDGSYRVLRGGSWFNDARRCRVSFRSETKPTNRNSYLGFRLVLLP